LFSTAKLAIVGAIVISLVGAFWYVSGLRADLERSQQNVRTLEGAVEEQIQVIDQMQRDQRDILAARDEMRELVNEQRQEIDDLRSTFNESANGSERDFGEIARAKPGLVENIINQASAEALRCMEIASGAEPTEEELNANIIDQCGVSTSP